VTTLGVSYYSLTALGCAASLEKRRAKVVALPGLAICLLGFLYLLLTIWCEWYDDEILWKGSVILAIFAVSFAQACLLSFIRLKRKLTWLGWTAHTAIFWLATLISVMIVLELDDEWLFRAAGVLGIVDGCASLTIPILAKLGGAERLTHRSAHSHIEIVCPGCGLQQSYPVGPIKCTQCGLKLRVEIYGATAPVEDPPFQFSIRSLLVLMLIVGAGLGLLSMRVGGVFAQWKTAQSLAAVGAQVSFSRGNVQAVSFSGPQFAAFGDEHIAMLAQLPEMHRLTFADVRMTDQVLRRLARLEISSVAFDKAQLPKRGLAHLRNMRTVWQLTLVKTPVAEQDIAGLEGCSVTHLTLRETGLTDEGLAHLERWPKLSQLDLGEPKITKAGLIRLKNVSTLNSLCLALAPGDKIAKGIEQELRTALPGVNVNAWDR